MMNTRVLQIAAIDEQIDLHVQELRWLGAFEWERSTKTENDKLIYCLARKIKLNKLKRSVENQRFVEMGYLDEFKELKLEIIRLKRNLSLKAEDVVRYKEEAKDYIRSNKIANLSTTQDSPYTKGADTRYISEEDDDYLRDSD